LKNVLDTFNSGEILLAKNKRIFIVIAMAIIFCCLAMLSFMKFNAVAERTSYWSGVSWLRTAILEELDEYYDEKGFYPQELTALEIPFPGDNAYPEMLKHFTYTTDGKSFKLILKWSQDSHHEWIAVEGEIVKFPKE
jgi:hypothetical protein